MKLSEPSSGQVSAPSAALVDWFTPGRFAGVLALLIVLCFPSVVFGLETFVYGDTAQFAYPVAYHLRESFWRGEIPLWNPSLNSCGDSLSRPMEHAGALSTLAFLYFIPDALVLRGFSVSHTFFLRSLGMYFLARRWIGGSLGAQWSRGLHLRLMV